MKRLILTLITAAVAVIAGESTSNYNLGTLSATGATISINLGRTPHKHTLQAVVTGSPDACAIQLEGSLDGSTWANLSGTQTCTSSVAFHVVDKPVTWIRANLTSLTGGTSPTVAIRYVGVQ